MTNEIIMSETFPCCHVTLHLVWFCTRRQIYNPNKHKRTNCELVPEERIKNRRLIREKCELLFTALIPSCFVPSSNKITTTQCLVLFKMFTTVEKCYHKIFVTFINHSLRLQNICYYWCSLIQKIIYNCNKKTYYWFIKMIYCYNKIKFGKCLLILFINLLLIQNV